MKLLDSPDIDREMIEKLLQLDAIVYPADQQGDINSVWERFMSNRDSYTITLLDGKPIGYLCVFPITDSLYEKIVDEKLLVDSNILPSDIKRYERGEPYNLYIISIVVHPDYQGSEALKHVLKGFADKIERLRLNGIVLNKILAQAITEKGYQLLLSLGFQSIVRTSGDSFIMESTADTVFSHIRKRLANWK